MNQPVPGFDVENTNQKARRDSQQEQINRSVLSKTLRILSLPNADKNGVNAVLDNFPKNVVKYERQDEPYPLFWAKIAGANDSILNLSGDDINILGSLQVGRKNLFEHNKQNETSTKVLRGQTAQVSDLENLSLYLCKKIRFYCLENKLLVPEIVMKNSFLMIRISLGQEPKKYKSTELAVLLGWQYDDWHGTPIKKLLTSSELENMEVTFNICILVKKGMYQLKGISG